MQYQTTDYGRLTSHRRQFVNAQDVPFIQRTPRSPSTVGQPLSITQQHLVMEVRMLQDHRRWVSVSSMASVTNETVIRDCKTGNAHQHCDT